MRCDSETRAYVNHPGKSGDSTSWEDGVMGRGSSNYPPELRERAVRMVAEVRPDPPGTDTYTDCCG